MSDPSITPEPSDDELRVLYQAVAGTGDHVDIDALRDVFRAGVATHNTTPTVEQIAEAINTAKHPLSCNIWKSGPMCSCGGEARAVLALPGRTTP